MGRGRLLFSTISYGKRGGVLNRYFNDISVECVVSEKEAWNRINDKPRLWK
jgi:hypothetical protein